MVQTGWQKNEGYFDDEAADGFGAKFKRDLASRPPESPAIQLVASYLACLVDASLFWLLFGGHYGLGFSATWKSLGTSYYSQSRRLDSAAYDLTRFLTCSGFFNL